MHLLSYSGCAMAGIRAQEWRTCPHSGNHVCTRTSTYTLSMSAEDLQLQRRLHLRQLHHTTSVCLTIYVSTTSVRVGSNTIIDMSF